MASTSIARRLGIAFLTIVTTLVIATSTPLGPATPALANGCLLWNGTVYAVDDEADLDFLRSTPVCLSQTLVQTADIDLSALNGSTWVPVSDFAGTYDGNGKTISGLVLDGNNAGLFGVGVAGATIKNLTVSVASSSGGEGVGAIVGVSSGHLVIDNVHASGTVTGSAQVGGLVGSTSNVVGANGTRIVNSSFSGTVTGTGNNVGGLVGSTSNGAAGTNFTITNSTMSGTTSGSAQVGGLIGSTSDEDVQLTGSSVLLGSSVQGTGNNIGGIVGSTGNGANGTSLTLSGINASGNVSTSAGSYVGGLVGYTAAFEVSVTNSTRASGTIQASGNGVGSLIGSTGNGAAGTSLTITNNSTNGNVTGNDYVGGLVGISGAVTISITGSSSVGTKSGVGESVGGIIGLMSSGAAGTVLTLTNTSNSGDVTGSTRVGGLVGNSSALALVIGSSSNSGNVTTAGMNAGGLVGMTASGAAGTSLSITNSTSVGNVTGSAGVGGLVANSISETVMISSSSVVGHTTGSGDNVGGLIGSNGNGSGGTSLSVIGSTVTGNVSGSAQVGGLVGNTLAETVSISSSSVVGHTTGSGNNVGGLVGIYSNGSAGTSLTITNSTNTGNVSTPTSSYVGGILGYSIARQTLIQSASRMTGNVSSAGDHIGGLIGSAGNGALDTTLVISGTTTLGTVTGSTKVGGLIGSSYPNRVTISASAFVGNVASTGEKVGGLVGESVATAEFNVSQALVIGNVSGSAYVAGIVGFAWAANVGITDSFARGTILGSDYVGGVAGAVLQTLTITRSYFQGTATATNATNGSFRGELLGQIAVTDSFCTDVNCPGASKVPVDDLKSESFLRTNSWDMTNVWCIRPTLNDGFPILRVFTSGPVDATACIPVPVPGAVVPLIRVTLDPNGGICRDETERSDVWTKSILGVGFIPGSIDCTRRGFALAGWADSKSPTTVSVLPLLIDPSDGAQRYCVAENLDLIAVWNPTSTATPTPTPAPTLKPTVFFGVRGWLCRNCGVLLFWSTPTTGTPVSVASPTRATVCTNSTLADGEWTMCHVKTGRAGTYTLTINSTTLIAVVR